MRRCSSSSRVKPPGPGRQVSSPTLTMPFGAEGVGSNLTLRDQVPESALVRLCSSDEGCGAEVSDWALTLPAKINIAQTVRRPSGTSVALELFVISLSSESASHNFFR